MSSESSQEKFVPTKVAQELAAAQRTLYAYIFSIVPSRFDADDLLQNTNKTVLRKGSEAAEVRHFLAWAKQVAYYEILAWKKTKARDRHLFLHQPLLNQSLINQPDHAEENVLQNAQELTALDQCKKELKAADQAILSKRYEQGMKASDIAACTGRNENSIRQQLFRIRNRLLKCIKHRVSILGGLG